MKTKEEIEQLAEKYYPPYPDGIITDEIRVLREGFIKGYRCQEDMVDEKYTEADIRKVIDETIKACNISQKESYGDLEIDTDKIINSLNKQD